MVTNDAILVTRIVFHSDGCSIIIFHLIRFFPALPEELEARLSRRQIETAEHADAERSQARAGALQTIEALAEVQRSLSQLAASVQPPPLPAAPPAETLATTLTHTEEELREAVCNENCAPAIHHGLTCFFVSVCHVQLSQLTAVVNTHLNALLWTQQEAEEAERTIQALAGSRSVLR